MAQTLNQPSPGPLEWKGEGVTIAQVLDALTDFRNKFAQAQVPDDDHPHPRNTVMTLIAVAATEAEEKRAISESTAIAMHHPSLVIVVRDQAEVKEGRIDASIAAPLIPAEGGADLPSHYELVTLHVRGAAASHLGALVDPWRETIAQFFAPVARRSFLSGITSIGIDYTGQGRGNRIPSSVLVGWIASAL